MAIVRDENAAFPGLAIAEKYEVFVSYIYPILRNCPRVHSVARDEALSCVLRVPEQIYAASKTQQVSKLNVVDGSLATLRFWLRFCVHDSRRIITQDQHRRALAMLKEVGAMVGGWLKTLKGKG